MPASNSTSPPIPELRHSTATDGTPRLELVGAWNLQGLEQRLPSLTPQLAEYSKNPRAHWDLNGIAVLDHAGAMLLWRAWGRRLVPNLTLRPEHELVFHRLDLGREHDAASSPR